jgi:hypothetical protein
MRMPKCSGIPERAGVEVIAEHQFAARTADDHTGNVPMPHQLSHFLTIRKQADRRYGIERYSKETVVFTACSIKRFGEAKFVSPI